VSPFLHFVHKVAGWGAIVSHTKNFWWQKFPHQESKALPWPERAGTLLSFDESGAFEKAINLGTICHTVYPFKLHISILITD
jgi:hypothetical protein